MEMLQMMLMIRQPRNGLGFLTFVLILHGPLILGDRPILTSALQSSKLLSVLRKPLVIGQFPVSLFFCFLSLVPVDRQTSYDYCVLLNRQTSYDRYPSSVRRLRDCTAD